jgi:hypothetical protein
MIFPKVNPYYVAAWSSVFADRLLCGGGGGFASSVDLVDSGEPIYCPVTHDELRYFLMAIHPPQLRITGAN